ncbi:TetR/AcrR family transcriptional regulator [Paenibacillus arenilitoris]|uniref:TetR/AcrR family transcriptional regulator n=1 Tax=Paenibacillus arenilitoris TaxID=2772299 RepID=A0A927CLP7_9BACL|nr:TetR/AcrR family transcriptional regulator [Paenibacillus arenilitoris]MBD2868151.1 TetR/AcrR family transcriptional regulator [Paenibacillus arenilitoris]
MFDKFLSIDEEKRQRVINAALKVFAQKGYQAASTNEIAREAGISKGLLFHYFTSKKDLYLYLYDYAVKLITETIEQFVDPEERDYFERLKQIAQVKLSVLNDHPDLLGFQKTIFFEDSAEVSAELKARSKEIAETAYYRLFADIDKSKFRPDIDADRAINVILWALEGMGEAERARHRALGIDLDIPYMMEEFDRYLELFKTSFYK